MDTKFSAMLFSYAFQDLSRKKIKKYATQYDGIDMALLLGADEDNFPFLLSDDFAEHQLMIWNSYNGIMEYTDDDPVRDYATVQYLRDHAYPAFESLDAAENWAREHDWPRKSRARNDA